jgi:hypothetical protein
LFGLNCIAIGGCILVGTACGYPGKLLLYITPWPSWPLLPPSWLPTAGLNNPADCGCIPRYPLLVCANIGIDEDETDWFGKRFVFGEEYCIDGCCCCCCKACGGRGKEERYGDEPKTPRGGCMYPPLFGKERAGCCPERPGGGIDCGWEDKYCGWSGSGGCMNCGASRCCSESWAGWPRGSEVECGRPCAAKAGEGVTGPRPSEDCQSPDSAPLPTPDEDSDEPKSPEPEPEAA